MGGAPFFVTAVTVSVALPGSPAGRADAGTDGANKVIPTASAAVDKRDFAFIAFFAPNFVSP